MDGRGAWRDNVFAERLWRTVRYEEVDLRACEAVSEARSSIGHTLGFHNATRPHSSLGGRTPDRACFNRPMPILAAAQPRRRSTYQTPASRSDQPGHLSWRKAVPYPGSARRPWFATGRSSRPGRPALATSGPRRPRSWNASRQPPTSAAVTGSSRATTGRRLASQHPQTRVAPGAPPSSAAPGPEPQPRPLPEVSAPAAPPRVPSVISTPPVGFARPSRASERTLGWRSGAPDFRSFSSSILYPLSIDE